MFAPAGKGWQVAFRLWVLIEPEFSFPSLCVPAQSNYRHRRLMFFSPSFDPLGLCLQAQRPHPRCLPLHMFPATQKQLGLLLSLACWVIPTPRPHVSRLSVPRCTTPGTQLLRVTVVWEEADIDNSALTLDREGDSLTSCPQSPAAAARWFPIREETGSKTGMP